MTKPRIEVTQRKRVPGRFHTFAALEDRSLAGYKAWIRSLGQAIAGAELQRDMTDADWEASWRRYWAYRDAPIKGRMGTD